MSGELEIKAAHHRAVKVELGAALVVGKRVVREALIDFTVQ